MTNPFGIIALWWHDRRGAAAVQFIVVLPVFALIFVGLWAFFSVYSARDAICDATDEARDYLQVEGPRFPLEWTYPADWQLQAQHIVESELKSHQWYDLVPVASDEVLIFPPEVRRSPQNMSEVSKEEVRNNWFFVRVTKAITNPMAIFMPDAEGELRRTITLSCQSTGFYEGDPIQPTQGAPPGGRACPADPDKCTPGPPPGATPTGCPIGQICDATPCPCATP